MAVHATTGAQSKAQVQLAFTRRISDILVFEPMFAAIQDASKAHGAVTEAGIAAILGPELSAQLLAEYNYELEAQGLYLAFLLKPECGGRPCSHSFLTEPIAWAHLPVPQAG